MSYGLRVKVILGIFFAVVLGVNGYFVHLSHEWASDDMRVGHGHSKFPPQVMKGAHPDAKKPEAKPEVRK